MCFLLFHKKVDLRHDVVVVGSKGWSVVFAFGGHQAPLFLFVRLVFVLVAEFMVFHVFVEHEQSDKWHDDYQYQESSYEKEGYCEDGLPVVFLISVMFYCVYC